MQHSKSLARKVGASADIVETIDRFNRSQTLANQFRAVFYLIMASATFAWALEGREADSLHKSAPYDVNLSKGRPKC